MEDLEQQAASIRSELADWHSKLEQRSRDLDKREDRIKLLEGRKVTNTNLLII